jgi:hypothetical protein
VPTTLETYLCTSDPKQPKFLDLLHGLYVLKYRNYEPWYDVHPVVVDTLKRQGLIDGSL